MANQLDYILVDARLRCQISGGFGKDLGRWRTHHIALAVRMYCG